MQEDVSKLWCLCLECTVWSAKYNGTERGQKYPSYSFCARAGGAPQHWRHHSSEAAVPSPPCWPARGRTHTQHRASHPEAVGQRHPCRGLVPRHREDGVTPTAARQRFWAESVLWGKGTPAPQTRARFLHGAPGIRPGLPQCWRWVPAAPHPAPSPLPQVSPHGTLPASPPAPPAPSFRPRLRVSCLGGGGLDLRRHRPPAAVASVMAAALSMSAALRHLVARSGAAAARLTPAR